METNQKIKDYLDSEGIICRGFDEILDMARDAGGDREKLELVLRRSYSNCQSEQDFYNKMFEFAGNAPIFDLLKGRSRKALEWMLGKITNKNIQGRVLDIGCGAGLEMCLFRELGGSEVIGIDINERLLIEAEKRIKRRGLKNIKTIIGDRNQLKIPKDYFDFITCLHSIVTEGEFCGPNSEIGYNYVIGDRIKQMAMVLKKGGIAVVSQPVSELYGELYQDRFSISFNLAGFSEILEKTQYSSYLKDRIFTDVLVAARK